MKKLITIASLAMISSGCLNMPTPSSQIGPSHVSSITYSRFSCDELAAEINSLNRRETALTVAQNQRRKTSQMQAFGWGKAFIHFGQGDGIEAAELGIVRGQIEAIRKEMDKKGCGKEKPDSSEAN